MKELCEIKKLPPVTIHDGTFDAPNYVLPTTEDICATINSIIEQINILIHIARIRP